MIAHAVNGTQFTVKARGQLFSLMNSIINCCFTRLIFISIRLGNTERYRTNLIQTGLQCAIKQRVELIQLTQRDFNGAHRTITFEDAFTVLVVVVRLGTQVCSANVFLRYLVLFKEGEILRHAFIGLLLR